MKQLRRKDRAMEASEARALLTAGEYGILSTVDEAGQPYGVPLNYVYRDDAIYFHCALEGHKLENIAVNPRVSFCVVGATRVLPAQFSTAYESVVAFGDAAVVQGPERENALLWLLEKYSSDFIEEGKHYIEKLDRATKIVKISLRHLSGKARR